MLPVMRDQSGEPQAKLRVLETSVERVARRQGYVCVLPITPGPCSLITDRDLGIREQGGVGVDHRQMPQVRGYRPDEFLPGLGEQATDVLGDPPDLAS